MYAHTAAMTFPAAGGGPLLEGVLHLPDGSGPFLDADQRPKFFIAGEHDPWAPADALREYVARLSPPKTLSLIPQTDHFLAGHKAEAATLVADFLAASLQIDK